MGVPISLPLPTFFLASYHLLGDLLQLHSWKCRPHASKFQMWFPILDLFQTPDTYISTHPLNLFTYLLISSPDLETK